MRKKKNSKAKPKTEKKAESGYPARELTEDTRWIVCMWDIKGDAPEETAMVLKRSLEQVREIIAEAKKDGLYARVKRHIKNYEMRQPFVKEVASPYWQRRRIGKIAMADEESEE